jgi:hypothetical protein
LSSARTDIAYFERHWIPWWVPVVVFWGLCLPIFAMFQVTVLFVTAKPPMDSPYFQFIPGAGCGLLVAVIVWFSNGRFRTITVSRTRLLISLGFGWTPLESIKAVAVLRGDEISRVRKALNSGLEPTISTASALVMPLTPALAVGSYAYRNIPRSKAILAPFWMHEAVAVYAPDTGTPLRLIGTRHPEELAAAIRQGAGITDDL